MASPAHRHLQRSIDHCSTLVRETVQVIGSKWAAPILYALQSAEGPLRYAEIQRRVGAITPKELARQLRALESAGLVGRRVYPTVPPKVEYRLTELGLSTAPVLATLADWGARLRGHPPRGCEVCGPSSAAGGGDERARTS